MKGNILIVDDEVKLYKSLARNFKYLGYQTLYAKNGQETVASISRQPVDIVLLDIMLGQENGLDVLKEVLALPKHIAVIMVTGYGSIDGAVKAIKLGAFDYITKPLDFDKLAKIVDTAIKVSALSEENRSLKNRLLELSPQLITENRKMLELRDKAQKLAATDLPVLIIGENGTGKEIIADMIHLHSSRTIRKLHKINCAAFPETLLDNELFGHEKGAYTGADTIFQGIFERADKGSLFLDEIGDMPLTIQAKILRTLQNHEIRRIGGERTITVNVRFIAATNKNLQELIDEKLFRKDLFYRLNTVKLRMPPLRERKDDIPLLIEHFLSENSQGPAMPAKTVSQRVVDIFLDYDWPGNVRELKNTINYAAAISSNDTIHSDDLPSDFLQIAPRNPPGSIIEEVEKDVIIKTLQKMRYNKKKTAELLNMSRNTLYSKLEKYGIPSSK